MCTLLYTPDLAFCGRNWRSTMPRMYQRLQVGALRLVEHMAAMPAEPSTTGYCMFHWPLDYALLPQISSAASLFRYKNFQKYMSCTIPYGRPRRRHKVNSSPGSLVPSHPFVIVIVFALSTIPLRLRLLLLLFISLYPSSSSPLVSL